MDDLFDCIRAPNITAEHAFLGRQGGVSGGVFAGLNLGLSSGDVVEHVETNRDKVLNFFDSPPERCCAFHQVHGDDIVHATTGSWFERQADAVITAERDLLLVVSVADCCPLLFYDPVQNVVAAAHCGWRGTVRRLAAKVVQSMCEDYGSELKDIRVAIGMAIQQYNYQVGGEVWQAFVGADFPSRLAYLDDEGRYRLDIVGGNVWALEQTGLPPNNIWNSQHCTYAQAERFFSYRRDKGKTGRHWALIKCPAK